MALVSRFTPRVIVVCLGLFVAPAVVLMSSSAPASNTCEALREWSHAYTGKAPTLDHVATFDRKHRIAMFTALTPEVRAGLWREQLRRFATRADLTAAQRAYILAARDELTPAIYAKDKETRRADARAFWTRTLPTFPAIEHQRAWFQLGSVVTGDVPRPTAGLLDRLAAPFRVSAQTPWCECSASYGWIECWPGTCNTSFCQSFTGCGPEGRDDCIGMCS